MWLLLPVLRIGSFAQDAVPYLAAGDLALDEPGAVYSSSGDLYETEPAFAARSCELAPVGTDCDDVTVAFVSTPLVLPLSIGVAGLGSDGGVLVMRFVAAGSLVAGMLLIWRRLAPMTSETPRLLVLCAVALTPFALVPIGLGQTSPLLFLSVALGISATRGSAGRSVVVAAVWAGVTVLKLFPLALAPLLVLHRRWTVIASAAVIVLLLSATALVVLPASVAGEFVESTRALASDPANARNPYSGSFESVVEELAGDGGDAVLPPGLVTAMRIALVLGSLGLALRIRDIDSQWAFASLALLLAVPLVWWHYLWVAVGALAVTLGARPRTDAQMRWLLWASILTVPISVYSSRGTPAPVAQFSFLVLAVGLVFALAPRDVGSEPATVGIGSGGEEAV